MLAVDNAWELLAILVYSLVWLKLELQFVVWNLSLSVKRHVHQQQDKGPYSLGSSFLLLLVLPFLVVWKTNVLWALCFFLLLLPLDYQAWKLWTKEILPQGGEYRLWQGDQSRRAGMPGATRAEDIPKKEEKKGLLERLSKKEEDIRMKEEGKGWKAVKELYSVLVRRELRLAPAFFFFLYLFFAGIGLILLLVFALDREDFAQFWEELPVALAAAGAFTGVAAVFTVGLETDQYHPANGRGIELFRLIPFTRKELLRGEFWRGVIYFGKMGLLLGAFFLFLGWGEPEAPFGCFLVPVLILVFIGVFGLLGSWRLYSGFGYQEVKR